MSRDRTRGTQQQSPHAQQKMASMYVIINTTENTGSTNKQNITEKHVKNTMAQNNCCSPPAGSICRQRIDIYFWANAKNATSEDSRQVGRCCCCLSSDSHRTSTHGKHEQNRQISGWVHHASSWHPQRARSPARARARDLQNLDAVPVRATKKCVSAFGLLESWTLRDLLPPNPKFCSRLPTSPHRTLKISLTAAAQACVTAEARVPPTSQGAPALCSQSSSVF